MTQFVIANNVNTQLAAALPSSGAGSTTVTLASSTNLPTLSAGQIMPLTLNDAATGNFYEVVYVTAISGVTLTVTRAQEGTGALNWSLGDYAYCGPTAGTVATADGNPSNTFFVAPATASQHAVQFGQVAGVVGSVRNLVSSVTTAGTTKTVTADEVIVETALGGLRYCLPSFSGTGNLATTGLNGMDTGSAPTSGFVAEYAVYNPTTGGKGLLYTNATSAVAPNVYGGANPVAGYTASALLSVWGVNGSGQFVPGYQSDRKIQFTRTVVFSLTSNNSSPVSVSAAIVPKNAKRAKGDIFYSSTVSTDSLLFSIGPTSGGVGELFFRASASNGQYAFNVEMITAQTLFVSNTGATGTVAFNASVCEYEI